MATRRITSVAKAIEFFKAGSKKDVSKTASGKWFVRVQPPTGFRRMTVKYKYGTHGCCIGVAVTQIYESFQWKDYAAILEKSKNDIDKLVVYVNQEES